MKCFRVYIILFTIFVSFHPCYLNAQKWAKIRYNNRSVMLSEDTLNYHKVDSLLYNDAILRAYSTSDNKYKISDFIGCYFDRSPRINPLYVDTFYTTNRSSHEYDFVNANITILNDSIALVVEKYLSFIYKQYRINKKGDLIIAHYGSDIYPIKILNSSILSIGNNLIGYCNREVGSGYFVENTKKFQPITKEQNKTISNTSLERTHFRNKTRTITPLALMHASTC